MEKSVKCDWKDAEHNTHYYYNTENGQIVGQVHNIAHTKIYMAVAIVRNNEELLGRYIALDFAKEAVSHYWNIQKRTLLQSDF